MSGAHLYLYFKRFAQLALSSGFNPAKVAVQLSNDLCRLFPVQLRQCGTEINAEIEYRKGAFFILSVNVLSIDWILLMKHFHNLARRRREAWEKSDHADEDAKAIDRLKRYITVIQCITAFDIIGQCLSLLYHFHWVISVPLCSLLYHTFLRTSIKRFIITAVTDEFFQYVESKGMEMDLEVVAAQNQAAFMLEALRQIRKDEQDLSKKISEAEKGEEDQEIKRGPLLGPDCRLDENEIGQVPDDLLPPANLEYICLEINLPVGYRRVRRAFLQNPQFFSEAIFADALKYKE